MGKSKRKQLARKQLSKTKKKTSDPFSRAKNPNPYASSGVGGNRFDIKDNLRAKHSVLGRKVKGRSRDVARARTLRRDEHESTLRPAIQNAHKVNTFVDKRLGEDDETLDQDDRDLKRFIKVQKDRFRTTGGHGGSGKTNKFNLVGGEEDDAMGGLTLTHAGQAVDDLDFSGHHGSDDDEREEDEQLGGNVVERLHFGSGSTTGGDQHGEVTKTREEIYKELIAKSKMYKAQRQQQKAVDGQEQESLDAEMDELRSMLDFRPKGKSKKEEEFEAMMERAGLNKDGDPVGDAGSGEGTARSVPAGLFKGLTSKERRQGLGSMGNTSEHDEFDIMARSLLFEARAQASDRTKTPEEKAKDEYEKMKEKEEERKKRARGDFINDNDDVDDEAYHEEVANRSSSGSGSSSSSSSGGVGGGDSLSANFAIDDEFDHTTREKEDDDAALLDNEGNETMDTATAYSSSRAGMRALKEREESEMPYVVKCPLTMSDFSTMVNKWTTDENNSKEIIVLIERIIKNHSVHLPSAATAKMSNRDKMSRLYRVLLDYIVNGIDYLSEPVSRVSAVLEGLFQLGKDVPLAAGECYREKLHMIHSECIKGEEEEGEFVGRRWCTIGEGLLLKSIHLLFPSTDFRHPVVTPALILLGGLLSGVAPMTSVADLSMAMYLSELQLDMLQSSEKLAVEAINMSSALLASLTQVVTHTHSSFSSSASSSSSSSSFSSTMPSLTTKRVNLSLVASCTRASLDRVPCVNNNGAAIWLRAAFEREQDDDEEDEEDETQEQFVPSSNKKRLPSELFAMASMHKTSALALLTGVLGLNERIIVQYNKNVAFCELAGPLVPLLSIFSIKKKKRRSFLHTQSNQNGVSKTLCNKLESEYLNLKNDLSERLKSYLSSRQPLQLQSSQKIAVPLRMQRPMFDENYIVKKGNDPDKERAELKSLKRKIKREEKAMARDVRKDSLFVAQEQEREREEWEADTKKKYNNFVEFVNQQHAAAKNVQREGVAHGGGMKSGRKFKRARHASPHDSKPSK